MKTYVNKKNSHMNFKAALLLIAKKEDITHMSING